MPTINLPDDTHRAVKIHCAVKGILIQKEVDRLIQAGLALDLSNGNLEELKKIADENNVDIKNIVSYLIAGFRK